MPLYELLDSENMPLLTISSENDETLETELVLFSATIAGPGGYHEIQKKEMYWKIIYARRNAKIKYLICKRQ